MEDLSKIKAENYFIFRERYDYGPFPIPYYYIDWVSDRCLKHYGAKITMAMHCAVGAYEEGRNKAVLGYKKEWKQLSDNILEKIVKDRNFVNRLNNHSKKIAADYVSFSRRLLTERFQSNSLAEKIRNHKKWIRLYKDYSFWNCLLWLSVNDLLVDKVIDFLNKIYHVNYEDILILISPDKPSFVFREEAELLNIALRANLDKSFSKQSLGVKKSLNNHAARWGFIPWDYIGPNFWKSEDFYQRIIKLSRNKNEIRKLIIQKKDSLQSLAKRQIYLSKKYHIKPQHLRLVKDLRVVTLMQDDKKDVCGLAQFALHQNIFSCFAERLGITARDCIKFSENELWSALKTKNFLILKSLPSRLKAITAITDADGIHILHGRRAKALYGKFLVNQDIREIKGQIASVGQARGRVKILLSPKEINKVRKGDVLVATMTTPDYVLAMRRASAIITDEGGMTSHAAIIARELKIPCIVGTKMATKILKDGDLVELDADKGIVKILKK